MDFRDYYGDLGVSPESTTGQINKAFRKLASYCYSDKSGSNNAEEFRKASKSIILGLDSWRSASPYR